MAGLSISHDDVIDVEFETVFTTRKPAINAVNVPEVRPEPIHSADQLSILREQFDDGRVTSQPDALSPLFLIITLFCAFIVFWVSGGHRLLY